MSQEELMKFLINRAKLGLNDGLAFGRTVPVLPG